MIKKWFLFLSFLLITGCGTTTKTLKCTISKDTDDRKVDIVFVGNWENENLKKIKIDATYPLYNTLTSAQKEDFQTYMDLSMATWKDKKGVKYMSNMESNSFSMSLEIDASKGQEVLKEFGIVKTNSSYETLKELLEKDKYVCE